MFMKVFVLLLYFFLAYVTYYRSQKYNANPYTWLSIGILVPYFSYLIAFLYFRKKDVRSPSPSKLPLGFRSKKPWKMILASIVYGFFILTLSIGVFTDTSTNSNIPKNASNTTSISTSVNNNNQGNNSETKEPDNNISETQQDNSSESTGLDKNIRESESEQIIDTEKEDTATETNTDKGNNNSTENQGEKRPKQDVHGELKVHFIDVGQAD